ncbi:MAG: dehydrogenase, short-chain alcohol dehydrogenase like protein [Myxococcaceae bacterium]|nr:dehydrogenase, short-chain alcohol dehydrogenase like protein [Myxococcaceae bacterium]
MNASKHSSKSPVAIVTGGGQGIGRAVAERLVADGYRVAIFERDEGARRVVEQAYAEHIEQAQLAVLDADVAREASVARAVAHTLKRFGRLDALVNNAGIANPYNAPIERLALTDWDKMLRTNLTGAFLCVKHSVRALRKSRRGAIVQLASTRALQSEPNHEAYASTKGGLLALTHALALSLGPAVRVNAISPGWIDTSSLKKAGKPAKLRKVDHQQHPVGRVGVPADVASLVAWLLSPESGFVTGQNFVIDGGMTRKMIYAE